MKNRHSIFCNLKFAVRLFTTFLIIFFLFKPSYAQKVKPGKTPMPQNRKLVVAQDVTQWPVQSKRWALLIGVDNVEDPNFDELPGAGNDPKMLADVLIKNAGFPVNQVILLANDQPKERKPTRANIFRYLSNLKNLIPKDGLLFVAFSGHGIERKGHAYLIPSDGQYSNDVELMEDTGVSVTRIHEKIRGIGVEQVLILLDACRNDPTKGPRVNDRLTEPFVRGFSFDVRNREVKAFATLYATEIGGEAYEYKEKRMGYFTWAIVEGLKGGAANERQEVTLLRLQKYVEEIVPKKVKSDLGLDQKPFSRSEGYKWDELLIAVVPSGGDVEEQEWEAIKNTTDLSLLIKFRDKYRNGKFSDSVNDRITDLETAIREEKERIERERTKREAEEKAKQVKIFDVWHDLGHNGSLQVSPEGIKYKEYGQHSNLKDDFVASCEEIKEARANLTIATNIWLLLAQYLYPPSNFHIRLPHRNYNFIPISSKPADRDLILGAIGNACGNRLGIYHKTTPPRGDAKTYLKKGNNLAKKKRWEEAEEEYQKAVELEPSNALSHTYLGIALVQLG